MIKYASYPKGSIWRKWDLHFHTPSSYDYQNKSISNEDIIHELRKKNVSVVAITDHNIIDVERVRKLQAFGHQNNITVLPGIEFRCELGGTTQIHFIGIFSEKINLEEAWMELQTECKLKPSDIERIGHEKIYVDFKDTATLIRKLGGIVSIHAGSKANSMEGITNSLPHKVALKVDISNFVDIFEMGKETDCKAYREMVFPAIKRVAPMIICSDNHNVFNYKIKQNLWIKADPNFQGLKQILGEPEERVKICTDKPNAKYKSNIIDKVRFVDTSGLKRFPREWIDLNDGLNTIIGGKSTGKSLLLYFIAKTIDYDLKSSVNYEFEDLDFELQWADNTIYKLGDKEYENNQKATKKSRPITYISQLYINDLLEDDKKEFIELILDFLKEKPIFEAFYTSHINSIREFTLNIEQEISHLINLKKTIVQQEEQLAKFGDKNAKSKELKEILRKIEEAKRNSKFSKEEEKALQALQEKNKNVTSQGKTINKSIHDLTDLKNSVDKRYKEASNQIKSDLTQQLRYLETPQHQELQEHFDKIQKLFSAFNKDIINIFSTIREKQTSQSKNSEELARINEQIEKLLEKSKFQDKIQLLNTEVERYEKELSQIEQKEKILSVEKDKLNASLITILDKYEKRHNAYLKLSNFINLDYSDLIAEGGIRLKVDISFDEDAFFGRFIEMFNLRTMNFSGLYSECFDANSYKYNKDDHINRIRKIASDLVYETSKFKFKASNNFETAIKALLEDFSKNNFTLYQGSDNIERMSPGKRGLILLKLYLSLNKADYPILIDQPEDNLDNRTVYSELKGFLKSKKIQRQIIMVTHNANLVIATDSEQVIVANQDGEDGKDNKTYKFEYVTGALEHTFQKREKEEGVLFQLGIREHVCEILEGGEEAFHKREVKYGFKNFTHNIN